MKRGHRLVELSRSKFIPSKEKPYQTDTRWGKENVAPGILDRRKAYHAKLDHQNNSRNFLDVQARGKVDSGNSVGQVNLLEDGYDQVQCVPQGDLSTLSTEEHDSIVKSRHVLSINEAEVEMPLFESSQSTILEDVREMSTNINITRTHIESEDTLCCQTDAKPNDSEELSLPSVANSSEARIQIVPPNPIELNSALVTSTRSDAQTTNSSSSETSLSATSVDENGKESHASSEARLQMVSPNSIELNSAVIPSTRSDAQTPEALLSATGVNETGKENHAVGFYNGEVRNVYFVGHPGEHDFSSKTQTI